MHETVNQEANGTAAAQQEPRTFTQDEVNAIVADRLTRERAKYADYDDLKGKAGRADEADSRAAALQQQLDRHEVSDTEVWLVQTYAILDDREMVEIRHDLNQRRQKLREQIRYNTEVKEDYEKQIL